MSWARAGGASLAEFIEPDRRPPFRFELLCNAASSASLPPPYAECSEANAQQEERRGFRRGDQNPLRRKLAGVIHLPHHGAPVVDTEKGCIGKPGDVERGELSSGIEEPITRAVGERLVAPDKIALVVDPIDIRGYSSGDVDENEHAAGEEEAVHYI